MRASISAAEAARWVWVVVTVLCALRARRLTSPRCGELAFCVVLKNLKIITFNVARVQAAAGAAPVHAVTRSSGPLRAREVAGRALILCW